VPFSDTVAVGQRLLTSGYSRRYPRGLPVGRIVKLGREASGLTQSIEVEPPLGSRASATCSSRPGPPPLEAGHEGDRRTPARVIVVLLLRSTALSAFAARGVVIDVLGFAVTIWALRTGRAGALRSVSRSGSAPTSTPVTGSGAMRSR
jgi:hypothetical protein